MQAPGKPSGLNNTAYIFGVVTFAFIVFITTRGDLPKWLGLLGLGASATPSASSGSVTGATSSNGLPALPSLTGILNMTNPIGIGMNTITGGN